VILALVARGPGNATRSIAGWLTLWSAYIVVATYWAKLIPLYAGYPHGRTVLGELLEFYRDRWPVLLQILSLTAMVDAYWVIGLAVVVCANAFAIAIGILNRVRSA
jgi:hypothetical protein